MLAVLARSWALCWRSWAALGAYVGGLGLLLGPMLTVLDRFRGLSGRSWDAFGPKLAVLGGLGAEVVGLGSDRRLSSTQGALKTKDFNPRGFKTKDICTDFFL